MSDLRDVPVIAAAQASEAVTELLRFYREGPASDLAFGDMEVCEKLAEALGIAIDIHMSMPGIAEFEGPAIEDLKSLRHACARYIAGWAG
jgi:hypothetical protein